nr:hypothetical protein [Tanacetum cinerariifolium]
MTTLAEYIIVARAKNRPLMLEKSMYDSWQGEDPIECINKAMVFLSAVASRHWKQRNCYNFKGKLCSWSTKSYFHTKDLDAYDSDFDDLSSAKAVLMENLSSCDSDVLFEESQDAVIQDTNSSTPNDLLVLSLFEQMTDHRIHPTLYDGSVIAKEHVVISVFDDEETLILEEESRSKMLDKQNDPILIEKKIKISPIDYSKLNKIKEDFGKHFVTKKELSTEQAFWLEHSSFSKTPVTSHKPVRIEAHSELSKDTFNAFDKTLLDEITEVQTMFNQMEAAVDQCFVDKNAFEIQIKQLSNDNDQLLIKIMSQEIMNIAVNFMDTLDVKKSCVNECNKCLELETELLKRKDLIEKALKNELRKLKGKNVVDTVVSKPNATITPGMFKLDIEPISHRLKNNRDADIC